MCCQSIDPQRGKITQATPSITRVRVREGRSSSVFTFVEGGKGSRDAVVVSFLDPFARLLHFSSISSSRSRRRQNFLPLPLGGWRFCRQLLANLTWPYTKIWSSSVYTWPPLFPIYGPGDIKFHYGDSYKNAIAIFTRCTVIAISFNCKLLP